VSDHIVHTADGAVRGLSYGDSRVFLNIPYAAPPSGSARFAAPEPHKPWSGVRDATRPGPTAPQAERKGFGALDMSPYFGPGWIAGDDYLTVNVWTPADGRRCPVMVFVHGGGFVSGSTRAPLYQGPAFARDGVVLVTVNYRLGAVGFLDIPGAPANRGLLDVVAALHWVRTNIDAFGGDPDNVTLFGQSAGATIVGGMLGTAEAGGLFHRAILQSGNGLGAFSPEQAERVTHALAEAVGIEPTLANFAEVPDQRLVESVSRLAGLELRTRTRIDPLVGLSPFSLVLDRQPAEAIRVGGGAKVDLIVGLNSEEGNLYLAPQGQLSASTAADVQETAARAHADPASVVAQYRERFPTATWGELRSAILGDALFGAGSRRLAEAHAAQGLSRSYTYEFAWRSGAVNGQLGAAHTVELPFVFDCLDLPELRGPRGLLGPGEPPARLAARMHGAWVRFAETGDPGWTPLRTHRFLAAD
jgi:para-nitrobenzyl esterase